MGGGSGGGGRHSLGDIKSLEKKARQELDKGARRNTFLSFSHDDIDEVNLLRAHAKNEKSEIEFIDRSVREPINSEREEYIKQKITEKIRQCSQTVVYITNETHKSKWVDWEVKKSLELGKSVLAVHKGDSAPSRLPSCIKDNDIKVVSWKDLSDYL